MMRKSTHIIATASVLAVLAWVARTPRPGSEPPSREERRGAGTPEAALLRKELPRLQAEASEAESPAAETSPEDSVIDKPAPDFAWIAEGFEMDAEDGARLSRRLEVTLRAIDWSDSAQALSMTAILQGVAGRHPGSLDLIEPYIERETVTHALISPDDPRPSRNLMDLYLSLVPDPEKQARFVLGLRAEDASPGMRAYYDSVYSSITGQAAPPPAPATPPRVFPPSKRVTDARVPAGDAL